MQAAGRLNIRVFTSRAEIPVVGATVVVTLRGKDRRQLLSVQVSDSSGNIAPILIPAPQPEESTQPNGGEAPFTSCDVWAEHPGYAMLLVEDVQIFPGVDTFQAMELTPLLAGQSSMGQASVRDTPPQDL